MAHLNRTFARFENFFAKVDFIVADKITFGKDFSCIIAVRLFESSVVKRGLDTCQQPPRACYARCLTHGVISAALYSKAGRIELVPDLCDCVIFVFAEFENGGCGVALDGDGQFFSVIGRKIGTGEKQQRKTLQVIFSVRARKINPHIKAPNARLTAFPIASASLM